MRAAGQIRHPAPQRSADVLLTKAAMLRSGLISAMRAAAAAPARNADGRLQNAAGAVNAPAVATVNTIIARTMLSVGTALNINPRPVRKHGTTVCQRRSPFLSALALTMIIAKIATVYGIAVGRPISSGAGHGV